MVTADPLEWRMTMAHQACANFRCEDILDLDHLCTLEKGHEDDHACGWQANGTRRTWPNLDIAAIPG